MCPYVGSNEDIVSYLDHPRLKEVVHKPGKDFLQHIKYFEFGEKYVKEEFILQMEMKKLMIDDLQNDGESSEDEVLEIRTVPAEKEKKV